MITVVSLGAVSCGRTVSSESAVLTGKAVFHVSTEFFVWVVSCGSGESCKQIQALGPRLGRDAKTRAGSVGGGFYTGPWNRDLQQFKCEVFKVITCLSSRSNF